MGVHESHPSRGVAPGKIVPPGSGNRARRRPPAGPYRRRVAGRDAARITAAPGRPPGRREAVRRRFRRETERPPRTPTTRTTGRSARSPSRTNVASRAGPSRNPVGGRCADSAASIPDEIAGVRLHAGTACGTDLRYEGRQRSRVCCAPERPTAARLRRPLHAPPSVRAERLQLGVGGNRIEPSGLSWHRGR